MGEGMADDRVDPVCVIAVVYSEPEWQQTKACLDSLSAPVFLVDRGGVGNLAEAYNRGFSEHGRDFEFVWFVSNVTFDVFVLPRLMMTIQRGGFCAVHPEFDSDHAFLCSGKGLESVPFVEFTAPLVRSNIFASFPLDEAMPYWGHDLDWGHRVREAGHTLTVDHRVRVGHVYVRNLAPHPVTLARRRERSKTNGSTRRALQSRYGPRWKERLCYGGFSWTATECSQTAP
jgi:hypothetical protein